MEDNTWTQCRTGQKVTDLISANESGQVKKIKLITQFDTADMKNI